MAHGKKEHYQNIVDGRPVTVEQLSRSCLSCSKGKASAIITDETMLLIDLTRLDDCLFDPYKSLIVFRNQLPVLTQRDTRELVSSFNASKNNQCERIHYTLSHFLKQDIYMSPVIDTTLMLIPLEGPIKNNSHYINYFMLDSITKDDKGQALVSFASGLDVHIPFSYDQAKRRSEKALELYSIYYLHEGLLEGNTCSQLLERIMERPGRLVKEQQTTWLTALKKVDVSLFKKCDLLYANYLSAKEVSPSLGIAEFKEDYWLTLKSYKKIKR